MRIAILAQPLDRVGAGLRAGGSVGIVAGCLARSLARDHDVLLVAAWWPGLRRHERTDEGVEVRRVDVRGRLVRYGQILAGRAGPHRYDASFAPGYARAAVSAIAAFGPDVVHVMTFPHFATAVRDRLSSTPVVLHLHSGPGDYAGTPDYRSGVAAADMVVCVSDHVADVLRARIPDIATPVEVVRNGVDETLFTPPGPGAERKPVILYVGRLSPEKGPHLLVEAFPAVVRAQPSARLTFVGPAAVLPRELRMPVSAPAREADIERFYRATPGRRRLSRRPAPAPYFRDEVDALPRALRERVAVLAPRGQHELPGLYRSAAILAAPSLWEGIGLPPLEAMACATPVVAGRAGGLPEGVVDGETGLLFDPGDAGQLATALVRLLADPGEARRLGEAGRRRVMAGFTWGHQARRLARLYAELA